MMASMFGRLFALSRPWQIGYLFNVRAMGESHDRRGAGCLGAAVWSSRPGQDRTSAGEHSMRWLRAIGRWGGLILAGVGFVLGLLLGRRRSKSLSDDAIELARDRAHRAREQAQTQFDEAVRQTSAKTDEDRRRAEEARRANPDRTLSDCFDELDASADR